MAACVAYLLGWLTGGVLFLIEKRHTEVRFHAGQSILLSIVAMVVYGVLMMLTLVPELSAILRATQSVLNVGLVATWSVLMIKAYRLERFKLPGIGRAAERWAIHPPL